LVDGVVGISDILFEFRLGLFFISMSFGEGGSEISSDFVEFTNNLGDGTGVGEFLVGGHFD
jgi:hypothetical protein